MSGPGLADPPKGPGSKFFGALLMAVGGLIATACGLCSLVLVVSILAGGHFELSSFILVALVGGIPTLIGAFIFWVGLRLVRPRRTPVDPTAFD